MKLSKQQNIFIVVLVIVLIVNVTFAQDWPQWLGPNRDAKVTGFTAPDTWPEQLTKKWSITVGISDATPALVGEKLYVFTREDNEEIIRCMDAETSEENWQDKYEAIKVTGGPEREHYGTRSTPLVVDDKILTLGVGGVLSCYDTTTGDLKWRKEDFSGVLPDFFVAMSPIVVDDMCIAHLGADDNAAVIAYDIETGEHKWQWTGDSPTYASPVLATIEDVKQIIMHTKNKLVSLAPADGTLLWEVPIPPQMRFYSSVTPIVNGQTVIYTGQGRGITAIKVEKKDNEFITTDLWSNTEIGTGYNTPLLKDGLLFGISDPGNNLFCMNAEDGKTMWTDSQRYDRYGTVVDLGEVILALPTTDLIVIEPDKTEYKELARYKVSDRNVYAYPVVAGNRIYVKDWDSLTLWTIE